MSDRFRELMEEWRDALKASNFPENRDVYSILNDNLEAHPPPDLGEQVRVWLSEELKKRGVTAHPDGIGPSVARHLSDPEGYPFFKDEAALLAGLLDPESEVAS